MTITRKERLSRLIGAITQDLDRYLTAPHEYTAEYFESVYDAALEAKALAEFVEVSEAGK
jgi:hypothetical protein